MASEVPLFSARLYAPAVVPAVPLVRPGLWSELERFQIAGRAIGGDDHLPARIDQRIEGMTKFSLDDLSLKELSVIEYQEIDRPQGFLECNRGLRLQCRDEPIHEFFGGQIDDGAPLRGRCMRDGLQQMRLAQADRGVKI